MLWILLDLQGCVISFVSKSDECNKEAGLCKGSGYILKGNGDRLYGAYVRALWMMDRPVVLFWGCAVDERGS